MLTEDDELEPTSDTLTRVIEGLAADAPAAELGRHRQLFQLMAAMRWPLVPELYPVIVDTFLGRYLAIRDAGRTKAVQARRLSNVVDLPRLITGLASQDFRERVQLVVDPPESSRERDAADIVRFLISWEPESANRRTGPSVKKAFFYIGEHRGYGRQQTMGWTKFSETWSWFRESASFHFVNEYFFKRRLLFDLESPTFADDADSMVASDIIRRLLAQACFVQGQLKSVLYESAWAWGDLPEFPAAIVPQRVTLSPPDQQMLQIMSKYHVQGTRGRKSTTDKRS